MLDHQPNDPIHHFNHQFNSKNGNYESWVQAKFALKARKPAEKYDPYSDWNNDGIQFRRVDSGKFESGVHSPPLWNNIPPVSPGSRLQAIVNGQKELMDMVKQMPESYYELTLKDLVDQTKSRNSQEECLLQGKEDDDDGEDQLAHEKIISRKLTSNKKFDRKTDSKRINGGSMENKGLFLKMVFPFGMMKSKKKKSMLKSSSSSAKINPKLDAEGCDRSSKYGDKDWLKKMFSSGSDRSRSSSGSHSTRTGSTGSNRSNIRTRRGFFISCLSCFYYSTPSKFEE